MANFCTRCGKKLNKDEKCTCEKIKATSHQVNQNNIIDEIKDFISKPFDTLKNSDFESNNYIILLLTAISSCLIGYLFLRINTISIILLSFIGLLLFSYILNYVANSNIKNTLSIVSMSSIFLLIGNIISFIFMYISMKLVLIILMLSVVLFMNSIYQGLCFNNDLDKNKNSYYICISSFITIIAMIFVLTLF